MENTVQVQLYIKKIWLHSQHLIGSIIFLNRSFMLDDNPYDPATFGKSLRVCSSRNVSERTMGVKSRVAVLNENKMKCANPNETLPLN